MTLGNELSKSKIEVSFSEIHLFGSYQPEPHHLATLVFISDAKDAGT